jgi:hypothetical protein
VSEFQINANVILSPEKIQTYLQNIKDVEVSSEILEIVFHYLIFICGKYLQMMVAYHIGQICIEKSDPGSITSEIQQFIDNHQKMLVAFYIVSGYELKPGRVPDPKVLRNEDAGK